jgi:iron complex transport system ATP-binding protein
MRAGGRPAHAPPPPDGAKALLEASGLRFGYEASRPVVDGVELSVKRGEQLALAGPNGAGKTTLLRLLGGTLAPQYGTVTWEGQSLRKLSRREIARRIAVVPQSMPGGLLEDFVVEQLVALGRTAHANWLGLRGETSTDRRAIAEAMALTGAEPLAGRPLAELSGGERQRALLAMALAQQPELLLLDEPTRHLDPHHQVMLLNLIGSLARERGLGAVAVLHDLNLAAAYFPRIVLMQQGKVVADGPPVAVLTEDAVSRAYGAGLRVTRDPDWPEVPLVLPAR